MALGNNQLEKFDIVQLDPETCRNPMFAGCLMVVSDVYGWDVQGYVQALGTDGKIGGQAYYRAKFDEISPFLGKVYWGVE